MSIKNILIVSEDNKLTEKIKQEFANDDVAINSSKDGRLALEMMAAKDYYAVIVDVDLQTISSYDLLYRLGILMNSIPIIAVSSVMTADDILLSYDFGVIDMLEKEFAPGSLAAVLKKAFEQIA